jgi:hypothetical protein
LELREDIEHLDSAFPVGGRGIDDLPIPVVEVNIEGLSNPGWRLLHEPRRSGRGAQEGKAAAGCQLKAKAVIVGSCWLRVIPRRIAHPCL